MKNRYPLLFAAVILVVQPADAQSYDELHINDVRARFHANGLVGFDPGTSSPHFEVPDGSGAHALYASGLWIGGLSPDEQLKLAATRYEDGHDFFPGPLTTGGDASITADVSLQYDQVWSVSREEVELHLSYFNCLADPECDETQEFPDGYTVPPSFFDWPAINPNVGYATYLAPFFDYNNDADYDPSDGDAPCILGDEALFFVFNDKLNTHTMSGGQLIGVEIQAMPFAFHGSNPALEQTVFVRYLIINRGTQTLHDTYLGQFNDFDLGCGEDDRTGTDPSRNLCYVYNGDQNDDPCFGLGTYGAQPPAIGSVLLKGPLMDPNGTDDPTSNALPGWNGWGFGDNVVDNERLGLSRSMYIRREGQSAMTDPSTAVHHYNYLQNTWKDGTPLTYGGTGYAPGNPGAVEARFVFPHGNDPVGAGTDGVPQAPWSEEDAGFPPEDSRILGAMGPFTLDPGEHIDIVLAYVYARATSGGAFASVGALQARVDSVRAFASTLPIWNSFSEDGFNGQCQDYAFLSVPEAATTRFLDIFPIPARDQVQVRADAQLAGELLLLRDATGRIVTRHRLVQGLTAIDIARLAQGVYTCEVRTSHARYTGRLVKE